MNTVYAQSEFGSVETVATYIAALSAPIDTYLEDVILDSAFYRIFAEGMEVGYLAIHKDDVLTLFHVRRGAERHAQLLFGDVRSRFGVRAALVPTCDEFFLSHALDECADVGKQAYFFEDAGFDPDPAAVGMDVEYHVAKRSEATRIREASGDFLDPLESHIRKNEVYVGLADGELVALGVVIRGRIQAGTASLGVFTGEPYRRRGIGRNTVLYLKSLCRRDGLSPIAGCGYGNVGSKRTLEAAGMVTCTRLLRIAF